MPRKQRFKPSRKPKPVWEPTTSSTSEVTAGAPAADHDAIERVGATAPQGAEMGDIESAAQARGAEESSISVIEDVASTGR